MEQEKIPELNPLDPERDIYVKEQQVKLIDLILTSLCTIELSPVGRTFIRKIRERLLQDIQQIRKMANSGPRQNISGQ